MSNSSSSLVRANLGGRHSLAALSNVAPKVIDAIVRSAVRALESRGNIVEVSGGDAPVYTRPNGGNQSRRSGGGNRRNRRNRGRQGRGGGGPTQVGPLVNAALPSVRRVFRGTVPINLTSGTSPNLYISINYTIGVISMGSWAILGPEVMGAQAYNFTQFYRYCKIHKIRFMFMPAVSSQNTLHGGLGYTHKNTATSLVQVNELTSMTAWKLISPNQPVEMTIIPSNAHGGVVPTSTDISDDAGERNAGFLTGYISSSAALGSTIGLVYLEVDATLSES